MVHRPVAAPTGLRAGLILLAASNTVVGAWLLFFPGSFFSDFPGLGMHWVAALPPYNEHLLTDYGAALLGIAAALWLAARLLERRLVQGALIAQLVQGTPHFVYHLTRFDALPTAESIASQLTLAVPVALPLLLLWLTAA